MAITSAHSSILTIGNNMRVPIKKRKNTISSLESEVLIVFERTSLRHPKTIEKINAIMLFLDKTRNKNRQNLKPIHLMFYY